MKADHVAEVSPAYIKSGHSRESGNPLPAGYKKTEIGVIPEDWKCETIGSLNPYVTSGSRGWAAYYSNFGNPFVRITNLSRRSIYLDMDDTKFVSLPENAAEGNRTSLENDDVLVSITADIGICSYVDERLERPAFINQHIALVRFSPLVVNSKFVTYFLSSEKVQKLFRSGSDQGAKAGMNLEGVRNIKLALPTKEEQTAIANALSDVDALISELEKLIAKKQSIKTATMQQLLTGRTRLPQFALRDDGSPRGYKQSELGEIPEDWKEGAISDVLMEISMGPFGSDIKVSNFVREGVPVLSGFNVSSEKLQDIFTNFVTEKKAKSLKKAVAGRGDIVVTHRGTIGQISYIPDDSLYEKYVISQSQFRARFDSRVLPVWVVLYFLSPNGADSLLEGKGHTGVPAIAQATTSFRKLKFPLPAIEEQTAIATILSDMDDEIQALEQRLNKTRQIKQGMMQELLMGKTRLIKARDAAYDQQTG